MSDEFLEALGEKMVGLLSQPDPEDRERVLRVDQLTGEPVLGANPNKHVFVVGTLGMEVGQIERLEEWLKAEHGWPNHRICLSLRYRKRDASEKPQICQVTLTPTALTMPPYTPEPQQPPQPARILYDPQTGQYVRAVPTSEPAQTPQGAQQLAAPQGQPVQGQYPQGQPPMPYPWMYPYPHRKGFWEAVGDRVGDRVAENPEVIGQLADVILVRGGHLLALVLGLEGQAQAQQPQQQSQAQQQQPQQQPQAQAQQPQQQAPAPDVVKVVEDQVNNAMPIIYAQADEVAAWHAAQAEARIRAEVDARVTAATQNALDEALRALAARGIVVAPAAPVAPPAVPPPVPLGPHEPDDVPDDVPELDAVMVDVDADEEPEEAEDDRVVFVEALGEEEPEEEDEDEDEVVG